MVTMPLPSSKISEAINEVQHRHIMTMDELSALWAQLHQQSTWAELGVLLACLGVSWWLLRLWRGKEAHPDKSKRSIWFGRNLVDGVLFPVMALLLVLGVRRMLLRTSMNLALFDLSIPLLVALTADRLNFRVIGAVFPHSPTAHIVKRALSWLIWIGTLLWLPGVMPLLLDELGNVTWRMGNTEVNLRNVIEGLLSAIVVMALALSLSSAIESRLLRDTTGNLSLRKIAANLIHALLMAAGVMMALSAAGINLTALSVLGGALGVGLGFGLQKLAANYVSGFVVLAEQSVRIGDLVKIDDFEGRITDIKTRYTLLRSANGRESIVPNEMLITRRVENASLADTQIMLSTVVQVGYGTDLDALLPVLKEEISAIHRVLESPGPDIYLSAFASDGLELTAVFWIEDPENGQLSARSEVNMALLNTLNRLNIEIPFPQRVVHTATPL